MSVQEAKLRCALSPPSALKAPRGLTLETPLSFMHGRCQPQNHRTHSFFCASSDSDAIQAETGCTPAHAASGAIPPLGSAVFPCTMSTQLRLHALLSLP